MKVPGTACLSYKRAGFIQITFKLAAKCSK